MKRLIFLVTLLAAVAVAQPNCSILTIRGTYAVSYAGWLTMAFPGTPSTTIPGAILGVVSIGFNGDLSGVTALAGFGPVVDYEAIGTVEVKPDCTGTMRLKSRPKGSTGAYESEVDRFVFDPETKTLLVIMVDLGPGVYPVVLGTWRRISPMPNAASW